IRMRRSLTATRAFFLLCELWVELRGTPWRTGERPGRGAALERRPTMMRDATAPLQARPRPRLVQAGQSERLAGRGAAAARRSDTATALAAALLPTAPVGLRPRQAGHALHELLHLAELLDELAHLARLGPAPPGDALTAGAVDDPGVGPLGRRHGADDGLHPVDLALVDLRAAELLRHAGHEPHEVLQRAHLADLLELLEEVLEREAALKEPGRRLLGLLLLVDLLGLLDERQHVAHAEDPAGQPVGVEEVEVLDLLAGRRE